MIINIPKSTLMKNQLTKPGWYNITIINTEVKKNKDGKTQISYTFKIDSTEKEITKTFNMDWLQFMEPLLIALNDGKPVNDSDKGVDVDIDAHKGRKLQGYVENTPGQGNNTGNLYDTIEKFLPLGVSTEPAF